MIVSSLRKRFLVPLDLSCNETGRTYIYIYIVSISLSRKIRPIIFLPSRILSELPRIRGSRRFASKNEDNFPPISSFQLSQSSLKQYFYPFQLQKSTYDFSLPWKEFIFIFILDKVRIIGYNSIRGQNVFPPKKKKKRRTKISFVQTHSQLSDPSLLRSNTKYSFLRSLYSFAPSPSPPPPKISSFSKRNAQYSRENMSEIFRDFSRVRVANRITPLSALPSGGDTLDVLCYRDSGWRRGGGEGGAQKGRNILWAAAPESLIRIYQKDWLLHCGPRSASVLLAIAIRNAFPWLRILTFRGMQRPGHNAPANLSDSS